MAGVSVRNSRARDTFWDKMCTPAEEEPKEVPLGILISVSPSRTILLSFGCCPITCSLEVWWSKAGGLYAKEEIVLDFAAADQATTDAAASYRARFQQWIKTWKYASVWVNILETRYQCRIRTFRTLKCPNNTCARVSRQRNGVAIAMEDKIVRM